MGSRERIREFIVSNFFVDAFGDDDSFLGTGLVDSLGMAQLVAWVEQTFAIAVAEEELVPQNLDSVARVAAFVDRKRRARLSAA